VLATFVELRTGAMEIGDALFDGAEGSRASHAARRTATQSRATLPELVSAPPRR
jgi:hypothetical protein